MNCNVNQESERGKHGFRKGLHLLGGKDGMGLGGHVNDS